MYEVYVSGKKDMEHETVEGLAEYLLVSGLMSDGMTREFESSLRECDTCMIMYDVLFAYLEDDMRALCNTVEDIKWCLHDAVHKVLYTDVISKEHGRMEYRATSGEDVTIAREG